MKCGRLVMKGVSIVKGKSTGQRVLSTHCVGHSQLAILLAILSTGINHE